MTGNEPGMPYRLASACGVGTCQLDFQACTVGADSPNPPEAVYESRTVSANVLAECPDFLAHAVRRIECGMGPARPAQVYLRSRWTLAGADEKKLFMEWLDRTKRQGNPDVTSDVLSQAEAAAERILAAPSPGPFELTDPDFRALHYLAERRTKRRSAGRCC